MSDLEPVTASTSAFLGKTKILEVVDCIRLSLSR